TGEEYDIVDAVVPDEIRDLGPFGGVPGPVVRTQRGRTNPRIRADPENEWETGVSRVDQLLLEPGLLSAAHAGFGGGLLLAGRIRGAVEVRHDDPDAAHR